MVAGSGAATVWVDTKTGCRVSVSHLVLLASVSRTPVEQLVGVCLSSLMMSNCCMVEDGEAPTGPGLTVETILGCIDWNTTSVSPALGLKPSVEHLAGTVPSGLLVLL